MAIEPENNLLHDSMRRDMLHSETRHEIFGYGQSRATSYTTNAWGGHGVSPYRASSLNDNSTLDPALRGNDFWSSQSLDFNQQLLQASSLGNQYNGSSFRDTNMPAQGTNNATEGIYHPEHPFSDLFYNIYLHHTLLTSFYQSTQSPWAILLPLVPRIYLDQP